MKPRTTSARDVVLMLIVLVFIYFVVFPDDVKKVAAPIAAVLELSQVVSPWLYMVAAVGLVAWVIVRIWGRKSAIS
jgi:uncharacterized membrane protein (DUF4010 family)